MLTIEDFKSLDKITDIQVIGEFIVDNHQFLILNLLNQPLDNVLDALSLKGKEVLQFQVADWTCTIVEITTNCCDNMAEIADLLTPRELQVATLVALGRVNKQIAKQLHISEWTVATYIRRIFYKLGVDSRAAMVYRCAPLIHDLELNLTEKL